ncbi:unnamed protein product [Toxocara canis]|uniref:ANK_REP_REGION domain-containing protein n=1 Tax=Toxocara canis TaxID=6265 RepID=A0A183URE7_TOXCA|nr:unnamed protein product [Toxocara canis]
MVLGGLGNFMRIGHRVAGSFDVTFTRSANSSAYGEKLRRQCNLYDDYPVECASACVSIKRSFVTRKQQNADEHCSLGVGKDVRDDLHSKLPLSERCFNEHDNETVPEISPNESPFEDSIGDHYNVEHLKKAFQAASSGDVITISACIYKLGVPVDLETLKGVSMLQLAITGDHIRAVKLLVDLGANINKATARGRTPLLTAARYGAIHSLKFLLQLLCQEERNRLKKLNVKSQSDKDAYSFLLILDENNDSALHLACRAMNHKCVKALLRVLIDMLGWQVAEKLLNQTNERGYAPIHVACMWRNAAAARLLLTNDCNKAIAKVCPIGRTRRIANSLRKASIDALNYNLQTGSILHEMACSKACNRCACEADIQTPIEGESPLNSIQGLPVGLVANYEEDDMDLPDRKCVDCEKRAKEVVKLVAKCSPQLLNTRSEFGLTPLMSAVARDALGIVEALLQLKVDLEAVDEQGRTAMHHAASRGVSRQVAILLSWGASPCRPDFECNRPMHYASVKGHTASLRFLYNANKHIDVASLSGHTAFMWAALWGCDASLRTMLNANPLLSRHDRDNEGNTALHLAAKRDFPNTVKLLVSAGWDIEFKNDRGESAFLLAAAHGSSNAMRALLTYGANVFAVDKVLTFISFQ